MVFSWILGKRHKHIENASEDGTLGLNREPESQDGGIEPADINLSVEDGQVLAFGPKGDPLPPLLLKEACVRQPQAKIRLPNGFAVKRKRLIDVIDAQQNGPLADQPSDCWVEAMLGAGGGFEPTAPEHLASEDCQGRSVLGGRLTLDMPGGETITLRDAHPGDARHEVPLKLMVDGKSLSIGEVLRRSGRGEPVDTSIPLSRPVIGRRGNAIRLMFGDRVEAWLEPASTAWAGEAKVELFLKDGWPVSVDDLTGLLEEAPLTCSPVDIGSSARSYPLLVEDFPAFDLGRATVVMVSGMPDDWSLSAGLPSEQGAWVLDPSALGRVAVQVPGSYDGSLSLEVKVISIVGHEGILEKQTRTVVIPPSLKTGDIIRRASPPADDMADRHASAVRLVFEAAETRLAAGADALLLRGVPKGASLSSGIFDPAVKGWVLKPAELDRLVVRDLDHRAETIEIELTAIHFEHDVPSRLNPIVKKSIIIRTPSATARRAAG